MGCCFSNDESSTYQDQDADERTGLLTNPVSGERQTQPISSYTTPAVPPQEKRDEQSALNRILHQTANNVIDVAAIDSHPMEQHEYMDRARHYSNRIQAVCSGNPKLTAVPQLPNGVAAPQVVLAAQPVSLADIQLITNASEQVARAVKEVKVKHKEDLVVSFRVP